MTIEELTELLAEQRSAWREARFKARGKQLKQFHTVSNFKKTIARISTLLTAKKKVQK